MYQHINNNACYRPKFLFGDLKRIASENRHSHLRAENNQGAEHIREEEEKREKIRHGREKRKGWRLLLCSNSISVLALYSTGHLFMTVSLHWPVSS